jgi:hypothetical protein
MNLKPHNAADEPRANSIAVWESGDRREELDSLVWPSYYRAHDPMVFAAIVNRAADPVFRIRLTRRVAPRTISLFAEHAVSNAVCLPATWLTGVCELMPYGPASFSYEDSTPFGSSLHQHAEIIGISPVAPRVPTRVRVHGVGRSGFHRKAFDELLRRPRIHDVHDFFCSSSLGTLSRSDRPGRLVAASESSHGKGGYKYMSHG